MSDSEPQAIASFHRWNAGFNARDMETMVAEMHFPHRRLSANNEFQVWETADDFRESGGERTTAALKAEGWDHTATTSIEAVQSGPDKVHLAINQSRRRADGTEYNPFPTLWIFTKIDGRWGVQFR
ncbi:MAG TPA: hypothetical protein DCP37_00295, partial [Dehalococcoidia bacterium]|nr:hypothetical protein [Dehalococcoidia bacterium]